MPTKTASGVLYYGFRYYDAETGRWPSRDPLGENFATEEFNEYAFVGNDGLNWLDYLGLRKTREDYARERRERQEARRRAREEEERQKREAAERRRRVDEHYRDNPTAKANACMVEVVWGHGGQVEDYIENNRGKSTCYGPLGCYIDRKLKGNLIPGFPDCIGGIGDESYCGGDDGNGGFNPNGGKTKADKRQGFATLLGKSILSALDEAKAICQRTYDKPPCCKKVVVLFNGIGERNGAAGNIELRRRLIGTKSNINRPPINGVHDGKKWIIDCKKVVK